MVRDSLGSWASVGCWALGALVALAPSFAAQPARAADAATAEIGASPLGTPDLQPLIDQLEAAEFAERQAASQKLAEAGPAAIPELQRAAESKSRETSDRALEILKRHFERGDNDAQAAARAALERLAASGQNAATARRADHVLNPPPEPTVITAPINAAQIQVAMANRIGRVQMNVRVANGKRDVEVRDNNRKIKIQTFPNGRIELEIAEPINGKEVTRKFEAKDLNELKQKDAEAGRVYEQYNRGGVQFALPPVFQPARARPAPVDPWEQMIKNLDEQINRLKGEVPTNPNLQRLVDSLEASKQRVLERQRR
jgi:hypothetical protein